jgi:hypothetical protein
MIKVRIDCGWKDIGPWANSRNARLPPDGLASKSDSDYSGPGLSH